MIDYPYFTENELQCKCGCGRGSEFMDADFMGKLIMMREEAGFPFPLSSAYRCPEYNDKVSSTGPKGPHTTGHAVDIQIQGRQAYELLCLATKHGITGIGISQKGAHGSRFIHVDDIMNGETKGPRPWVWSY